MERGKYGLQKIRYVGVGAMVIGGISSIFRVRKGLVDAIRVLKNNNSSTLNQKINKERNISLNPSIFYLF